MARSEMETIKDLDIPLLKQYHSRMFWYFAEKDDWVGEEKEKILACLSTAAGHEQGLTGNVVQCRMGIPHAFCIVSSILVSLSHH